MSTLTELSSLKFAKTAEVKFLGWTVRVPYGIPYLPAMTKRSIVPAVLMREKGMRYRLRFLEALPAPARDRASIMAATQDLYSVLEREVRHAPDQWAGWTTLESNLRIDLGRPVAMQVPVFRRSISRNTFALPYTPITLASSKGIDNRFNRRTMDLAANAKSQPLWAERSAMHAFSPAVWFGLRPFKIRLVAVLSALVILMAGAGVVASQGVPGSEDGREPCKIHPCAGYVYEILYRAPDGTVLAGQGREPHADGPPPGAGFITRRGEATIVIGMDSPAMRDAMKELFEKSNAQAYYVDLETLTLKKRAGTIPVPSVTTESGAW